MDENKERQWTAGETASNPEESESDVENTNESELEGFEPNEPEEVESGDEGENSDTVAEIDHEAELAKERERLGRKIDKERQRRLEAERNKGLSREEVEEIVKETSAQIEKRLMRARAEELAEKLAKSPAEKERILLHYDNSIIPTGNLEEDIGRAYAIVSYKRIPGQLSEIRKAQESKRNIRSGDSGAGAPAEVKKPAKYSKEVLDAAKFAGVSPEEFVKKQKQTI